MKQRFFIAGLSLFLMGCAPIFLGAGTATGYVASQERSFEEAGEDIALKARIWEKVGRMDGGYVKDLSIRVRFAEVFITGVVGKESEIAAITQMAEKVDGVKRVINAVQLKPYPVKEYLKDVAVATSLKSRLLFTEDVYTSNYEVTVVKGQAYLFGWAYTPKEVEKAVEVTRKTSGVDKVHNYLRVMPDGAERLKEVKRRAKESQQESYGVDEVQ